MTSTPELNLGVLTPFGQTAPDKLRVPHSETNFLVLDIIPASLSIAAAGHLIDVPTCRTVYLLEVKILLPIHRRSLSNYISGTYRGNQK